MHPLTSQVSLLQPTEMKGNGNQERQYNNIALFKLLPRTELPSFRSLAQMLKLTAQI
jgi:hypothetical protein